MARKDELTDKEAPKEGSRATKRPVFEVRLKPGHPTGTYHRAGLTIRSSEPLRLEKVPDEIRTDPWLTVTEGTTE